MERWPHCHLSRLLGDASPKPLAALCERGIKPAFGGLLRRWRGGYLTQEEIKWREIHREFLAFEQGFSLVGIAVSDSGDGDAPDYFADCSALFFAYQRRLASR